METFNMFLALFVLGAVNVLAEKNLPLTGIAYVEGPDRKVTGNITFTQNQCGEPVFIRVYVQGLEAGLHGFHVHEKGDLTNGCMSAGGHYNPDKMDHGAPSDEIRHVGDLGNIRADALGIADTTLTDHLISLAGPRSIFGRALVIHTGEDDLGLGNHPDSKKTGNAGGRAACGVIGIKSPADGFWKVCSAGTAVTSASYFYSITSAVTILVYSILKL